MIITEVFRVAEEKTEKKEKKAGKKGGSILKIVTWVMLFVTVAACGTAGYLYYRNVQEQKQRRADALEALTKSMTISFLNESDVNSRFTGTTLRKNDEGGVFEYGTAVIDPADLVGRHGGELTVEGTEVIDTSQLTEYELTFRVSGTTEFGDEVSNEAVKRYRVEDTAPPVIELADSEITITEGDAYDPMSNVVSVTDPVDGEITSIEISSDFDREEPGTYTVTVASSDIHGNRAEKTFTIKVKEKPVSNSGGGGGGGGGSSSGSSGYNLDYAVYVNCAANTVTVYSRDSSGNYTVPVKAMVCSTGSGTPRGTYYTYDDPSNSSWYPYYPWWPLYGGVYGMYAYGITGDILFHSVPYYSPDHSDLEWEEYNKLGTSASMGCVRLAVKDVIWIFEHCPHGTMVVFYDDASNPGPLGKPEPIHIDPSSPYRGWDPTDPDPSNPWNS